MSGKIVFAETYASVGLLDDTVAYPVIKERLVRLIEEKAAEAYPGGYTLTEIEPQDAFIQGPEILNMITTPVGKTGIRFRLYCEVRPSLT